MNTYMCIKFFKPEEETRRRHLFFMVLKASEIHFVTVISKAWCTPCDKMMRLYRECGTIGQSLPMIMIWAVVRGRDIDTEYVRQDRRTDYGKIRHGRRKQTTQSPV